MKLETVVVPVYGNIERLENVKSYEFIEGVQISYLDLRRWGHYLGEELPVESRNCAVLNSYLGHVYNGGHGKYISVVVRVDDPSRHMDRLVEAMETVGVPALTDIGRELRAFFQDQKAVDRISDNWGFGEADKTLEELDTRLYALEKQELYEAIRASLERSGKFQLIPAADYPREVARLSLNNENAEKRAADWSPYIPGQMDELHRYSQMLAKLGELKIGVKRLLIDSDSTVESDEMSTYGPRRLRGYHFDSDIGWILASADGGYELGKRLMVKRMPDGEILHAIGSFYEKP